MKKNMILGAILCAGVSLWALDANAEDKYKYGANGNQTSMIYYYGAYAIANNAPTSKSEYTYDSNGNQLSEVRYEI